MALIASVSVVSVLLVAQSAPRALDEGVADRGPLSRSLYVTPIDLRQPTGFDDVYRSSLLSPEGDPMFERRSGALRAAFPRSIYEPTRFGETAAIPPGTIFYIGEPPAWEGTTTLASAARPANASAFRSATWAVTQSEMVEARVPAALDDARLVEMRARRVASLVELAARGG